MKKVLAIVGPTAVGKTSLGIACAKEFNGEVISGDSIQVYKGLDIGSAKINEKEKQGIAHYLIDIKEADDFYSVKEFQEKGRELIEDISKRGKLPIIVGGTGLYIKALLYDYVFYDEKEKDETFDELSNEEIYNILLKKDPECLNKIHVNNRKRLVRALNILKKHDLGISKIKNKQEHILLYDAKIIGLTKERAELYGAIEERIDKMLDDGLLDEIQGLLDKGITFNSQSMQGIGYKEFEPYFNHEKSLEDCINEVKRNTKHFAKRQYTWFNNQMPVFWFDDNKKALTYIRKWIDS